MMIRLDKGNYGFYYLTPVHRVNKNGSVEADEVNNQAVQTDWDYPGVASTFGWSPCHPFTDGTIDCSECGKTASELISEASDYLDDHIGDIVDDPGYFG